MENCHGRGRRWKNMDSLQKKKRERERGRRRTTLPATTSQPSLGLLASSPSLRALQNGTAAGHGDAGRAGASPGTAPASSPEPWGIRAQSGNGAAGLTGLCIPQLPARCGSGGEGSRPEGCCLGGHRIPGVHPKGLSRCVPGQLPGAGGGLGLEGGGLCPLPSSLRPSRDPGAGSPRQVNSGLPRRCRVDGRGGGTPTTRRVGRRFVSLSATASRCPLLALGTTSP